MMAKREIERGLFAGRFQPFHRGHLEALMRVLDDADEAIVAVAATDANFTMSDPFTAGERLEMIWMSLDDDLRQRVLVLTLPNIKNNRLWPDYVRQYLPKFQRAFTNNPLQAALMRASGTTVHAIERREHRELSGTAVRELLRLGDKAWRATVSPAVAAILDEIGAEARLRNLG
jgi:nicotinamide-nucleotide adenylyltransferase